MPASALPSSEESTWLRFDGAGVMDHDGKTVLAGGLLVGWAAAMAPPTDVSELRALSPQELSSAPKAGHAPRNDQNPPGQPIGPYLSLIHI